MKRKTIIHRPTIRCFNLVFIPSLPIFFKLKWTVEINLRGALL